MPRRKRIGGAAYMRMIEPMMKKMIVGAIPKVGQGRKRVYRRRLRGAGFFGDLWSGVKSVGSHILPVANDLLKKSGIVSSGLSMLPVVGNFASNVAKSQGYGRRKKRAAKKRIRGGMSLSGKSRQKGGYKYLLP